MLVQELKELIEQQKQNQTLILTSTVLNSINIQELFQEHLPEAQLIINQCEVNQINNGVIVTGQTNYRNLTNVEVEAEFFLTQETVKTIITIYPDKQNNRTVQWKFSHNFSELSQSFYDELTIIEPKFILASQNQETVTPSITIEQGLNFQGKLTLPDFMQPVSWLLNNTAETNLNGTIVLRDNLPEICLTAETIPIVTFGFLTLEVKLQLLTTIYSFNPHNSGSFVIPALMFVSQIQADPENQAQNIKITANISSGRSGVLSFIADLGDFRFSDLAKLSHLVNGANLAQMPPEIKLADVLKLSRLTFIVSPRDQSLVSVSLEVHSSEPWIIIEDILEIELVKIAFSVNNPTHSPNVYTSLFGEIKINSILIDANLTLPDKTLIASLAPGSTVNITDILEKVLPSANLPQFEITELRLQATYTTGAFFFEFEIVDDWEIIKISQEEAMSLSELYMVIERSGTGQSTASQMSGIIRLADLDFMVAASHPEGDVGWQFSGNTWPNQSIPIGNFIKRLEGVFGEVSLPSAIKDSIIKNVGISFNTETKDFNFTCEGKFPVDGQEVDITINTAITRQEDGSFKKEFSGYILIDRHLQFDLILDTDHISTILIAAYSDSSSTSISIKELVGSISSKLKSDIPEGLTIAFKDALFVYSQDAQTNKTQFLFAVNIGSGINLSYLPLVGSEFPPDKTISVDNLQILVASEIVSQELFTKLNGRIPTEVIQLPVKAPVEKFCISALMKFGESTEILTLPITDQSSSDSRPTQPVTTALTTTVAPADNTKWFSLQKAFGPVHFKRIGVQYQDAVLWFLLDAALSTAGLTLSLEGLSFGSPLTTFDPHFNLHGIGIDYQGSGTVAIGGAFLKQGDEYSGTAFIKTADLTLSAVGSYYIHTPPHGDPSLFIYALLNKPIGGPAFFFVTGLAAAFGYNRALTLPTIDQVATFPLIQAAISSTGSPTDLSGMLRNLDTYIKPATGEVFLAVGVKFTSFKLIDSFALLIATFGDPFELHILGLSTLITPTPEAGKTVTPLAEVQMALKATFIPEQGFLAVNAQLTPSSYIFSKACHLVGGFAYYSWFSGDHAGDFVITLGGYHPDFNVPTHYPQVPRLGFNWQVDEHLTIKGDAYYALTPAALMAGGHLQARWESGPLCAWFNAGANFLIAWKPYHYEASIYVDMGVSYTFEVPLLVTTIRKTISVDIGADLEIWGPDFSGIAHIHLWIVSFDVSFGNSSSQQPQAIDWSTFKASFLPADDQICSITVKDGLVRKISEDKGSKGKLDLGAINPKDFALITNSVIPSNQAYREKAEVAENAIDIRTANSDFGIGSMEIPSGGLTSTHTISITRDGIPVEQDFDYIPILKNVPKALWGTSLKPDLNEKPLFIEQVLSGFEIKPKQPVKASETQPISQSSCEYSTEQLDNAYSWNPITPFSEQTFSSEPKENARQKRQAIALSITKDDIAAARTQLLQALDLQPEFDLSESLSNDFLLAPQIELQPS